MPYTVDVLPERQLGVVRFSGTVTGETILQAVRELCTSEEWKPTYHSLWDARQIGALAVSPLEVAGVLDQVRHFEDHLAPGRTAAVVGDRIEYALAQMFFLKGDTGLRERKVFYSLDEALGWIGAKDASSEDDTYRDLAEEAGVSHWTIEDAI